MVVAGSTDYGASGPRAPLGNRSLPSLQRDASHRLRFEHLVMAAAVLCLIILVVLPICFLIVGSLKSGEGLTFRFFRSAFADRLYLDALRNSLILGSLTGIFSVAIGLPLAWAVTRTNVPGKPLIRATATLSYLSPPFLIAIAFVNLLSPNAGIINVLLRDLDLPWLTFNVFSMQGLVLVTVLHTFPFVYLLAASALASVDASYEEAAQILGAGKWRTALTITLPLVMPAILSGVLIAFINSIALFGSQAILGLPGRIFTLPTRIYSLFDYPPQYGIASALSLVFIVITVAALFLQRSYLAKRSFVTLAGKGSRPQLIDLGGARWLVLGFCILVFIVSIVMPYGSLLAVSLSKSWGLAFWKNLTLHNYIFVLFQYDVTRRAILNSLLLATLAATIAVALGTIISWIDLRTHAIGRRLLDYAALIPLGLPGIVMAVALIQFWLAMPIALYGTLAILLLAYVGRYIPLGARSTNASLRQVDTSLEESARILGASWGTTIREVTLPLIWPGLFAGWLLIFVPAIQELSASILLFSSKSITLAVAVYNLYETGYTEPVAALAIINVLIIAAAIWLASKLTGGSGAMAAVTELDLDIGVNQFVTLLGPSGCGKTTTLRLIAGYMAPDAGTITVDGKLMSSRDTLVLPEHRGMGMVFQNYAVWPHKTVFENVVFGLKLRKVPSAKAREMVEAALTQVNLSGYEDRLPSQLSGGQQQRVALARSLVVEPDILLLDEPLSNLDAKLREHMRGELKQLQRRTGITFIYVTHDQSEALALSDMVAVIHAGKLQQFGTPEEVYSKPANRLVADFMGSVNLLPAEVAAAQNGHGEIVIAGALRTRAALPDGLSSGARIEVAVRPESVLLSAAGNGTAKAEVTDRTFLGNLTEYQVRLGEKTLRVQTHPKESFAVGAKVGLSIDPDALSIFAAG